MSEIKDFAWSSPSDFFFGKSLRWWTQKSGKSLLLPPSVDTIAKIPLRRKRPFCSIIISNVLLKTIKNSKHSLRPVSHILHNFLRLYCKTFLSQGFPVKHFNFKMNWLVHFYDYLTLWCSLQSILSIHMKNYLNFLNSFTKFVRSNAMHTVFETWILTVNLNGK